MILDYGFSLIGKSHIERNSCCQDSHCIKRMKNGWVIAAIADGVGSASNSHIGSKIATDTVVEFCDRCMPWDYNIISTKSMLRTAFNYAYKLILEESEKSGEPIESYDTTLSVVIYDGQRIIYGHSGDGAIIGLTSFGDFVEISRAQKGPDGVSVIPLRGGYTQWAIDAYEEDLVAVMLMTDGMFETLCPYLLKDSFTKNNKVYTPLGSFFADPKGFNDKEEDLKTTQKLIENFLVADDDYDDSAFYDRLTDIYKHHIPNDYTEVIEALKEKNFPVAMMKNEQDDKTMVGLINIDAHFDDKDKFFYAEPDWQALQEAWNRMAYPHLYESRNIETDDNSVNATSAPVDDNTKTDAITSIFNTATVQADGGISVNVPIIEPQNVNVCFDKTTNVSQHQNNVNVSVNPNNTSRAKNPNNYSGYKAPPKHNNPKKSSSIFEKAVECVEKGVIGIGKMVEDFFVDERN